MAENTGTGNNIVSLSGTTTTIDTGNFAGYASAIGNTIYTPPIYWSGGGAGISTFSIDNGDRKQDDKHVLEAMKEVKASAKPVIAVNKDKITAKNSLLKELGFSKLSKQIEQIAERSMKENLASLAGYKKIPWDMFQKADKKLRGNTQAYKTLAVTLIEKYLGQHYNEGDEVSDSAISLPPTEALEKLAIAKKAGVFDGFSIIHVVRGPDPILVGTVKGTKDMFMIAEWGDDISFEEIMK